MSQASPQSQRILIVDDHADTLFIMERLIKKQGHQTFPAESYQQAIDLADQGPFDLIISDVSLPDGDGLKLLSELRRRGSPAAKGITLSGYSSAEDIQKSRDAGYEGYLTKPIQFDQLIQLLATLSR